MHIEALRKLAGREELDYPFLMDALKGYASPRDKISRWLKTGALIRVKKGLYLFGPAVAQGAYSLEVLANLIYGPSALSFSYALSFYGFIPERVSEITSITYKRHKAFSTPLGKFSYTYISAKKYAVGIELKTQTPDHAFLMASPEKALCDQLCFSKTPLTLKTTEEMGAYLFYDLRIDRDKFKSLSVEKMFDLAKVYVDQRIDLCLQLLKSEGR